MLLFGLFDRFTEEVETAIIVVVVAIVVVDTRIILLRCLVDVEVIKHAFHFIEISVILRLVDTFGELFLRW